MTIEGNLLEVEGVTKRFGGLVAVDDCSFGVESGSVTGLIGPNGAGKSTLFDIISGVSKADAGRVTLAGTEVSGGPPERVARYGLARTFQTPRLFYRMSCWENLMLAGARQPGETPWGALAAGAQARNREFDLSERAHELLDFLQLSHLSNSAATALSGGQRKLLSLGRALMTEPRLILLDEPAAGVNASLTRTLMDRIAQINAQGVTFLIVEHDMDLIMTLCQQVVVMHQGSVLASGKPGEVQSNRRVVEAYLGGAT